MRRSLLLVSALALVACRVPPVSTPTTASPAPAIPPLKGPEQIVLALKYIEALPGTGAPVLQKQCVYVNYTGWLTNGTKFDSSRDTMPNGQPRTPIGFPLGFRRVIAGLGPGLRRDEGGRAAALVHSVSAGVWRVGASAGDPGEVGAWCSTWR